MTTTSRFPWWTSLALLVLGGGVGLAFLGPVNPLPVARREAADRNVLRVVYTQALRPDPLVRPFPLSAYNLFIQSLWEPLVECDPLTGEPRPAAAASWSWSADYRVLTFKLRPDARWSNGDPVVAQDFVRAWLRLLRSRVDMAYALFPIRNAEAYHRRDRDKPQEVGLRARDDLTLQIELAEPRTTFVAELADPMLSPIHASLEAALDTKAFFREPGALVTNGPFRLKQASADGYRLEAAASYHGRAGVQLAGVRFIRASSPGLGALLVAAGTADLLPSMSFVPEQGWPTRRPMVVESELALGVLANYVNVARGPLSDVRVRQALAMALNREDLIDEPDRARLVPAWSWVPDMPGRRGLSLFTENPAEARRLLAEAGYPGGKGFPVLRMSLPLWMDGDPRPTACSETWFKELGVRVYVSYEESEARTKRLNAGDYDLIYGTLIGTVADPADLLTVFSMPLEFSETKWRDDEAIRLLTEANSKLGAERLALIEQAERRAMAAAAAVPLLFERRQALHSLELKGWYADPLARQATKRLWLEQSAGKPADEPGPGA